MSIWKIENQGKNWKVVGEFEDHKCDSFKDALDTLMNLGEVVTYEYTPPKDEIDLDEEMPSLELSDEELNGMYHER